MAETLNPVLGEATVQELREATRGEVFEPSDEGYLEACRVWNGVHDERRPAIVVRCGGAADVIAAVSFARSNDLDVAVRGGGHSVAGFSTCDGGIVIDTSPMSGVRVDPAARRAYVGPGAVWGEVDQETQAHGLATTGGLVSTTGVAGFTLGGGIGWLMRKYGLACDNLSSAEVVTADGRIVRASESENSERFWGLRGGGGNFGVVTEFEFKLHPVSQVMGGMVAWPADAGRDILRFWRDWVRQTPDELCTMAAFLYAPPEPFVPEEVVGSPIFAIACCHLDPEGSAEDDLRALRELGPAVDVVGPMPYQAIQGMFDAGVPRGSRNYWRSGYVDELTDDAIDAIIAHREGIPHPLGQLHVHQMGGAMSRTPAGATSFGSRDAGFLMNYISLWLDPADDEKQTAWAKTASDAMAPYGTGTRYVNFLADEGEA